MQPRGLGVKLRDLERLEGGREGFLGMLVEGGGREWRRTDGGDGVRGC